MIICGIIQSPEQNNDQLLVRQIEGNPQNPDSIINAQINLTSKQRCLNENGVKGWRNKKTKELYLQTTTQSLDSFGRPITFGIYLKKEGKEPAGISRDAIVRLLNTFSLEMDAASISRVESFIAGRPSKKGAKRKSFCAIIFVVIFLIVLTSALIAFFSK